MQVTGQLELFSLHTRGKGTSEQLKKVLSVVGTAADLLP